MAHPKGYIPWNKGLTKKTDVRVANYSNTMKVRGIRPLSRKGTRHSEKTKKQIGYSQIGIHNGAKNHRWKGGITPMNIKIRNTYEYRLWRKAVLQRDNFTCQKYGITVGKLVAHHINSFADFPELRLAIDNGIILSQKAHLEFHKKYGQFNNTQAQINEFLKSND